MQELYKDTYICCISPCDAVLLTLSPAFMSMLFKSPWQQSAESRDKNGERCKVGEVLSVGVYLRASERHFQTHQLAIIQADSVIYKCNTNRSEESFQVWGVLRRKN